jgi:hypothetical protein
MTIGYGTQAAATTHVARAHDTTMARLRRFFPKTLATLDQVWLGFIGNMRGAAQQPLAD